MRNIDQKYGISEKAKEVGTKASNIINSPEVRKWVGVNGSGNCVRLQ